MCWCGMETSPRDGEADMENLWQSSSDSRAIAMSHLVLSSSFSSSGTGYYDTDLAEASSVRFSPYCPARGSSGESTPVRCPPIASGPVVAGPSMVRRSGLAPQWLYMGDTDQDRPTLTGAGHDNSHSPRVVEAVGVVLQGHNS